MLAIRSDENDALSKFEVFEARTRTLRWGNGMTFRVATRSNAAQVNARF